MLQDRIEKVIEFATGPNCADELNDAKAEYGETIGSIFDDDESFDSRMASFLEWYVFDRILKNNQKTPLSVYIDYHLNDWPEETKNHFLAFKENIHSLFIVKKPMKGSVLAINLFDQKKYTIEESQSEFIFRKNDIFEGRAIPLPEGNLFTGTYCFHPQEVTKFIKNKIEAVIKERKLLEDLIKKTTTELEKLDSKIVKLSIKSERLSNKIASTNSESKKESLEKDRKKTDSERLDLECYRPPLRDELDDIRTKRLGIKIPLTQKKLMLQLSFMNLRWERSRQIDIKNIYK